LREGCWTRETPPPELEIGDSRRVDAMLLRELNAWGCK
jgi:hypothetical protein